MPKYNTFAPIGPLGQIFKSFEFLIHINIYVEPCVCVLLLETMSLCTTCQFKLLTIPNSF